MSRANHVEAERAFLAGIFAGVEFNFDQLAPQDFFLPLHRRLYVRLQVMDATEQPVNVIAVSDALNLDDADQQALAALMDSGYGPFNVQNQTSYARMVRRGARQRELQAVCQRVAEANGDIPAHAVELHAKLQRYLEVQTESEDADVFQNVRDYEEAPPMKFAIDKFLQENAVNAIAGLSGHGKTWLALSMARALLFGPSRMWQLFDVPERAERVIYLIPESSIGPFKHRLQLTGLYDEISSGRLLTRTLSKGPTLSLQDPRLLGAVKNAHVICDTAIRFMLNVENENNASDAAKGLSEDFFALLRAGAKSVLALFHSPKSFNPQSPMTLESMIRGSSELGAMLATAWGIRQVDPATNTVQIGNLKARDFDPCQPFQLRGRPAINNTGDFELLFRPGDCPESQSSHSGGAPQAERESKAANLALLRTWLAADPDATAPELRQKFADVGITVTDSTVRSYKSLLKKEAL